MQSLVFLACCFQKLSMKNRWGSARPAALGKGRVKLILFAVWYGMVGDYSVLLHCIYILYYIMYIYI